MCVIITRVTKCYEMKSCYSLLGQHCSIRYWIPMATGDRETFLSKQNLFDTSFLAGNCDLYERGMSTVPLWIQVSFLQTLNRSNSNANFLSFRFDKSLKYFHFISLVHSNVNFSSFNPSFSNSRNVLVE